MGDERRRRLSTSRGSKEGESRRHKVAPLNGILKGTNTDIRVQPAFISHVGTTFEVPSGGLSNTNDKIGR